MNKIKKVLATALVGVLAFSITGCKMIAKTPESIQNTVLAKVGDQKITKGDVDKELKPTLEQLKQKYGDKYEEEPKISDQLKQARVSTLNALIDEKVLLQKAEELKLVPSKEELDKEVQQKVEDLKKVYGTEEALNKAKESYGYTDETFNEFLKNQVITQKVKDYIFKDINVTDEDVKKYYDEHQNEFGEANVSHIVVKDEAKAKEVRERAAKGEDFATLAKEYSEDTGSKDKGGEIGVVPYNSTQYVKEFVNGFKSLGEGEISQPVKSQYGYHIIKATNVKKESFDKVKDQIKEQLKKEQQDKLYKETLDKWKKELDVKVYEDRV